MYGIKIGSSHNPPLSKTGKRKKKSQNSCYAKFLDAEFNKTLMYVGCISRTELGYINLQNPLFCSQNMPTWSRLKIFIQGKIPRLVNILLPKTFCGQQYIILPHTVVTAFTVKEYDNIDIYT